MFRWPSDQISRALWAILEGLSVGTEPSSVMRDLAEMVVEFLRVHPHWRPSARSPVVRRERQPKAARPKCMVPL